MITDKRREARILALQALCQLDVQGDGFLPQLDAFLRDSENERRAEGTSGVPGGFAGGAISAAAALVRAAWHGRAARDEQVVAASEHWRLERMALVDRNLIRLAVCELLEHPGTPLPVVINEAVEIAREFGDADSPRFVNGVLDAVWHRIQRDTAAPATAVPDGASAESVPGAPGRRDGPAVE